MPTDQPEQSAPPDAPRDLTVRQKILLIAVALTPEGGSVRSEYLAMAAAQAYPENFQLGAFERVPDTARLFPKLAGADGVVGLGWLRQESDRTFSVTPLGRDLAVELARGELPKVALDVASLSEAPKRPAPPPGAMRRGVRTPALLVPLPDPPTTGQVALVRSLAGSLVLARFERGQPLGWPEALLFWRAKPWGDTQVAVRRKAEEVGEALTALASAHRVGRGPTGATPAAQVQVLLTLHQLLVERLLTAPIPQASSGDDEGLDEDEGEALDEEGEGEEGDEDESEDGGEDEEPEEVAEGD